MAVTFERLAGNTADFAIKVALETDPHGGADSTPEESASWGRIEFWIKGSNLCLHTEGGETLGAVNWYLLPMLEWFATNWDYLLHEQKLPNRNAGDSASLGLRTTEEPPESLTETQQDGWAVEWQRWWERHSLRSCREGGFYPGLVIRRWRDDVELSWDNGALAGMPEDFVFLVPSGNVRLSPGQVGSPLHDALLHLARHLRDTHAELPRFADVVRALEAVADPNRYDLRVAILAGLGADIETAQQSWARLRQRIEGLPGRAYEVLLGNLNKPLFVIRPPAVALMFGAVSPQITERDVDVIVDLMSHSVMEDEVAAPLEDFVAEHALDHRHRAVGRQAKRLAEEFAARAGVGDQAPVDIEGLLDRLGVARVAVNLEDSSVRGISLAGSHIRPTVALNTNYRWQTLGVRRLTLAHELEHLLFDRIRGVGVAVASGEWAPRDVERRANAFAVELLLPTKALANAVKALGDHFRSPEGIRSLSDRFQVSGSVVCEVLLQRGYLSEGERDLLADTFHWSRMRDD